MTQTHATAVMQAESAAMAEAAIAEGLNVEAQKRSELEAPAKAMKAKIIVDSQAQAEQSKIHAEVCFFVCFFFFFFGRVSIVLVESRDSFSFFTQIREFEVYPVHIQI